MENKAITSSSPNSIPDASVVHLFSIDSSVAEAKKYTIYAIVMHPAYHIVFHILPHYCFSSE